MDVYDALLTQAEIQGNINKVNEEVRRRRAEEALQKSLKEIDQALDADDPSMLLAALSHQGACLKGVEFPNGNWYLKMMKQKREVKRQVCVILTLQTACKEELVHILCSWQC